MVSFNFSNLDDIQKSLYKLMRNLDRKYNRIKRNSKSHLIQMRKVRLTNKQKQIRFFVILIVLFTILFRGFQSKPAFIDNYVEHTVIIKSGDKAWNIQSELTPNADIRKLLYYVGEKNNKNSMGDIIPGEELTFYKYKDNK